MTRKRQMDDTLCMSGTIRTKEKCPKCRDSFKGNPLGCKKCKTTPGRCFIDIYVKRHGRIKIYSDRHGHLLDSHRRAARVLEAIRYEIDQHIFDPSKYVSADLKSFLFETLIEAWYESKDKEREKGNLAQSYTRCLKRYKDEFYLSFFKGIDVREIRTYHIQQFYENLPSGLSLKYTKNIMNALENFFNILRRLDKIEKKPAFPTVTLDRKAPRWVDRVTQQELLNAIPESDRPIFTFLAFQGIRPGEARALKVRDIDFENECFIILRTYSDRIIRERVKGKVSRPRAINPVVLSLLKVQCRDKHPEAFVFLNPRTNRPYAQNTINKIWAEVQTAKRLDLPLYNATRHSLASNLLKDGADLKAIGDILGHTDIRTTLKYAHSTIENQRIAFSKQGRILKLSSRAGLKKQGDK